MDAVFAPATPVKGIEDHQCHEVSQSSNRELTTEGLVPDIDMPQYEGVTSPSLVEDNKMLTDEADRESLDKVSSQQSSNRELTTEGLVPDIDIPQYEGVTSLGEDNKMHIDEAECELFDKVSSQQSEIAKGDKGENQGVESSKKLRWKPKRKKHRPKVIKEVKPMIMPKPVTPMPKVPRPVRKKEKLGKRSYMKKNTSLDNVDSKSDVGEKTVDVDIRTETMSIRRHLNFDVEEHVSSRSLISTLTDAESQAKEACASAKLSVEVDQLVQVVANHLQEESIYCCHNRNIHHVLKDNARLAENANTPAQISRRQIIRENLKDLPREKDGLSGPSDAHLSKEARERIGVKRGYNDDIHLYCTNEAPGNTKFIQACVEIDGVFKRDESRIHDPFYSLIYKRKKTEHRLTYSPLKVFIGDAPMLKVVGQLQATKLEPYQTRRMTKRKPSVPIRGPNLKSMNRTLDSRKLQSTHGESLRCDEGRESKFCGPHVITHALDSKDRNLNHFQGCHIQDNQMTDLIHDLAHVNSLSLALVPYRVKMNTGNEKPTLQSQSALALYGGNGMIVPYENPSDRIRKETQRAEVDLDLVSIKIWELIKDSGFEHALMSGLHKEKHFVEDMQRTHGRIDLFIYTMRLMLGDRRFSQWKGEVLDSVVGVFLTQNVSDNLSSSAYMKLAARFPLQPRSRNSEKTSISMEHQDGCISASDDMISFQEEVTGVKIREHGSVIIHESEKIEERCIANGSDSFESNARVGSGIVVCLKQVLGKEVEKGHGIVDAQTNNPLEISESQDEHIDILQQEENEAENIQPAVESDLKDEVSTSKRVLTEVANKPKDAEATAGSQDTFSCQLQREAYSSGYNEERSVERSVDWEAVRKADVNEIAKAIEERGMQNILAGKIKDFLNRLVKDHGSLDLEWLRAIPPDKAKEYLLSIRGLGLKSVECVRLLTLNQIAFPVDTNVARVSVRLGWVPLQPLPGSLELHLLEEYPVLESIQKYLWPRLCTLDREKLYELHYHMITFGKVFCTKRNPNCDVCPMKAECRHFASKCASARRALPCPEEKHVVCLGPVASEGGQDPISNTMPLVLPKWRDLSQEETKICNCEPIIEEPTTPISEGECIEDIEDMGNVAGDSSYDPDEIPTINLIFEKVNRNVHDCLQVLQTDLQDVGDSMALALLSPESASMPMPKLKNMTRLRTEHQVYVLPDSHPLLETMDKRDPKDPSPYLLAIWAPGETAVSTEACQICCNNQSPGSLCDDLASTACNCKGEVKKIVRGTILIPCRTAMRGRFPLNGTYFQINEVFADHETSDKPIDVPRDLIWYLPMRTVYIGSSVSAIFRGLKTEDIQNCFCKGYVCVRGFDRVTREPRRLSSRLHQVASKAPKREDKAPKKSLDEEKTTHKDQQDTCQNSIV